MMKTIVLAAVCASVAAPALAAPTIYTDQAAFLAATGATQNGFPLIFAGPTNFTSYTLGTTDFSSGHIVIYPFSYGPPNLGALESPLSFQSTSTSLGFDLGTYASVQTVSYTVNGFAGTFIAPANPTTAFLGFVDTSPISGTFSFTDEFDVVYTYTSNAMPAPAPAAWTLLVGGFGVIGCVLRRRKTFGANDSA